MNAEQPHLGDDIEAALERLRSGDESAIGDLISVAFPRLEALSRRMLATYPAVAVHEQTHDVLNQGCLRLAAALRKTIPTSKLHFQRLAARHIRFTLGDLKRHYYGPQGYGRNVAVYGQWAPDDSVAEPAHSPPCQTLDPVRLAEWTEFHRAVDELPEPHRVLFDLLYYAGMSQREAATVLGVAENTIQLRWQRARRQLARNVALPGSTHTKTDAR